MIKGLNSFRFFSFLAVFLFHSTNHFEIGYLGVSAFFVLSGFLITPILLNMKGERTPDYFTKFYGRRFIRIFPLCYFYLAAMSILLLATQAHDEDAIRFFEQLPFAALYIYNFFHASSAYSHTSLLTHFWSLGVEEQFYLVWPLIIFFVPAKKLKKALILTIILSVAMRILFLEFITHQQWHILNPDPTLVIYVLPTSHFDAFAIGGFFAIFIKDQKSIWAFILAAAFVAVGLITYRFATGTYYFASMGYPSFMGDSYKSIWGYSFANLVFAFIILNIRQGIFFPRIFNNKAIDYLGKISYGLYVYHYSVLHFMHKLTLPNPVYILLSLMLTIIISLLSYELIEKKILLLKDRFFPVRRTVQAAASQY